MAKNTYYKKKIHDNQGNPKQQWKIINNILGKSGHANNQNIHLIPPCAEKDVPIKFNEYYLKTHFNFNSSNEYKSYLNDSPNFSMYLPPTNKTEIESNLNKLKTDTPGYDEITPRLLKQSSTIISASLTHIINLTLKTGKFPDQLKKAKAIPIYKSGGKTSINNYRPISILPAFCKVF